MSNKPGGGIVPNQAALPERQFEELGKHVLNEPARPDQEEMVTRGKKVTTKPPIEVPEPNRDAFPPLPRSFREPFGG